ncbi:FliC/FljB family flagellin [Alcaligenes sp. 13f]|uniref:FliC/FljB family flagellin n=1 Tax=Alcaligenes sp. 13f TaxID=2841924 RepID=UPI001CF606E1|nr:FliC/FljB family flagellin [Alcaligenes sp. 13f]MCB4323156.1 FliC/FljB family flagellin [Alcaligenes sp. 13f]
MSVINTNYLALVSQNNLTKSQNSLGTAIERLSSGLRINSAKDDAAGQAIANRFTANINGLTQAARNANDGISIAQTTEGSLNEINENLQRIRTLTVQASTGSNSDSDLQSIQNEINERLAEINRVSKETQFNGKYVLGEDASQLTVQVGANDNETITIDLKKIDSNELNLANFNVTNSISTGKVTTAPSTTVTVTKEVGSQVGSFTPDADDMLSTGSFGSLQTDGTDYYVTYSGGTTEGANPGDPDVAVDAKTYRVTITDGKLGLGAEVTDPADIPTGMTNTSTYKADITATGADADKLHAYTGKGRDYVIQEGEKYFEAKVDNEGKVTRGAELSTVPTTEDPLATIDAALQQVDDLRSHLGAIQNRFQSTIANLNNTVNNLSAARSRIEDADYAVEVSNMTRAQILQQAGTSVLAQANQVPQTVLSLLR